MCTYIYLAPISWQLLYEKAGKHSTRWWLLIYRKCQHANTSLSNAEKLTCSRLKHECNSWKSILEAIIGLEVWLLVIGDSKKKVDIKMFKVVHSQLLDRALKVSTFLLSHPHTFHSSLPSIRRSYLILKYSKQKQWSQVNSDCVRINLLLVQYITAGDSSLCRYTICWRTVPLSDVYDSQGCVYRHKTALLKETYKCSFTDLMSIYNALREFLLHF